MRLFAAALPSPEAREHLVSALRPIRAEHPLALRWVDPDNWHYTLCFYGTQPDGVVDELAAAIAANTSGIPPATFAIRGAGSFNSGNLWCGIRGDLRALMAACTPEEDEAARRPHLTVARVRDRRDLMTKLAVADIVRALSVYEGPAFLVDRVALISSHLGQGRGGGPRYETVAEVLLR